MIKTALAFSHELLEKILLPGDNVVDATVGNGFDTCFLAKCVGKGGQVFGFDIQKQAIERTSTRLEEQHLREQVTLYHKGHEMLAEVLPKHLSLSAAIFNLGYLPSSDKKVVTHSETTIKAVESLLPLLKKQGVLILVIYYGHEGGTEEKNNLLHFTEQLPQEFYNVLTYQFVNQKNNPSILLAIEKKSCITEI